MQRRMLSINESCVKKVFLRSHRHSLHTGEVTVGYIVLSGALNIRRLAMRSTPLRVSSQCEGGEILVSEATATAAHSRYHLTPRDPITVKNREQPVPLFEVEWQHATSNA